MADLHEECPDCEEPWGDCACDEYDTDCTDDCPEDCMADHQGEQ